MKFSHLRIFSPTYRFLDNFRLLLNEPRMTHKVLESIRDKKISANECQTLKIALTLKSFSQVLAKIHLLGFLFVFPHQDGNQHIKFSADRLALFPRKLLILTPTNFSSGATDDDDEATEATSKVEVKTIILVDDPFCLKNSSVLSQITM